MNNSIRYPRILNALQREVWGIEEGSFRSIVQTLHMAQHGSLQPSATAYSVPMPSAPDDESDLPAADSIGVIEIHGIIAKYVSGMEVACGAFSLEHAEAELELLAADPAVKAIVLHFDSPGGVCSGQDVFAARVAEINADVKPVYAFTDTVCASAAYWMAAGCGGIFSTPYANVGSIGVFCAWIDESKWMEKEGVELKIFKAGRLKALHLPGQMTDEGEVMMQGRVDAIWDGFKSFIREQRGDIDEEAMQGQCFLAKDALAANLIDEIVPSFAALLRSISGTPL